MSTVLCLLVLNGLCACVGAGLLHDAEVSPRINTEGINDIPSALLRVIIIGATGNLATKYLWVACFRLALELTMTIPLDQQLSTRVHFITAARDSSEQGTQWMRTFFDDAFLQRVCGSNMSTETNVMGQCRDFFHIDFLPRIKYVSLQQNTNYAVLAAHLRQHQPALGHEVGRLVYLAIPPAY